MANTNVLGLMDIPELETSFIFRRRPIAIPGDLRPGWRIGLLTLFLSKCCRGCRSSITRIHVLSWAVRTEESRELLRSAISGVSAPDALIVRFEPSLNRAIDFAIGEGLISRSSGSRIELTTHGRQLAEEILAETTLFVIEKEFMTEIRQKVTEVMVDAIFSARA